LRARHYGLDEKNHAIHDANQEPYGFYFLILRMKKDYRIKPNPRVKVKFKYVGRQLPTNNRTGATGKAEPEPFRQAAEFPGLIIRHWASGWKQDQIRHPDWPVAI
jgi:hypothetical protein